MGRVVHIWARTLLVVGRLESLSQVETLQEPEHFDRRHHELVTEALGLELRRTPSESALRSFFLQVHVKQASSPRSSPNLAWLIKPLLTTPAATSQWYRIRGWCNNESRPSTSGVSAQLACTTGLHHPHSDRGGVC